MKLEATTSHVQRVGRQLSPSLNYSNNACLPGAPVIGLVRHSGRGVPHFVAGQFDEAHAVGNLSRSTLPTTRWPATSFVPTRRTVFSGGTGLCSWRIPPGPNLGSGSSGSVTLPSTTP